MAQPAVHTVATRFQTEKGKRERGKSFALKFFLPFNFKKNCFQSLVFSEYKIYL
jgi:hypothetical protein